MSTWLHGWVTDPDEDDRWALSDGLRWDDDVNRCPRCGSDLDAEGFCQNSECGWSIDDDEYDD